MRVVAHGARKQWGLPILFLMVIGLSQVQAEDVPVAAPPAVSETTSSGPTNSPATVSAEKPPDTKPITVTPEKIESTVLSSPEPQPALNNNAKVETTPAPAAATEVVVAPPAATVAVEEKPKQEAAAPAVAAPSETKPAAEASLADAPSSNHPDKINAVLKSKFRTKRGTQVHIYLFPSLNQTDLQLTEAVNIGIEKTFARLDSLTINRSSMKIRGLSLENFQRVVAKTRADILLLPSLKATKWDLILYDRRNPYQVVLQSEVLSETFRKNPTESAKTDLIHNLVNQLLQQYALNETFDLPREASTPILQTDIPRWMASTDLMKTINSEMRSHFYLSASLGGMITAGYEDRGSNSSVLALQLGYRPFRNFIPGLVFEVAGEMFNYNAVVAGLKYFVQNKTTTARFYAGLGYGYVTTRKTIATDTGGGGGGLGRNSRYLVPSLAMVVPLGDILVKVETQYFTSIDERTNSLFSFLPGIFIPF